MKTFLKNNSILILGAFVPCIVIGYFVASASIPLMFTDTPQYDFIYYEEGYRGQDDIENRLYVRNGKLHAEYRVREKDARRPSYRRAVRLHLYDSAKGVLREIPLIEEINKSLPVEEWHAYELPELKGVQLNSSKRSPDEFTVEMNSWRSRGIFQELFVGSRRRAGLFLVKNGVAATVVDTRHYYYSDNFRFLGWVLPNKEGEAS